MNRGVNSESRSGRSQLTTKNIRFITHARHHMGGTASCPVSRTSHVEALLASLSVRRAEWRALMTHGETLRRTMRQLIDSERGSEIVEWTIWVGAIAVTAIGVGAAIREPLVNAIMNAFR